MSYPYNVPTSRMSPPQFASSSSDAIEVRPQFPMNNERFEPGSTMDISHSFKRPRMSDNSHSNTITGPPPRMNHPPPNRPTGNIFFKTRICTKFGFGTCRNGENCTFAHGVDEIRKPPPNWQELVRPRMQLGGNSNDDQKVIPTEERMQLGRNWNDDQKIIHEMKLCKKYYNGEECPYGDKCNFLHEDPAMFRDDSCETRESSAISIATFNNLGGNRAGTMPARGTYWKTKICHKWMNTGSCPFGDNCHYVHADAEAQVPIPGGGIEAEAAVAIANSAKDVIPTLPTIGYSVNNAPTTLPANVPVVTEEEKKAKKELLWKKLNKINRIYGDWIDD
ncbi:zinc finger CCCH domain-containing protein 39-like [Vicia villosa]|uniref:zinc finger CCCH domain-containing protein 39-like n=1 Tax=Vicia villosa TaxID=3911 RepID=UPI00273B755B|nr:zinc finger CCCH domain-containing protein 39-like [Vicia villosa]